MKFQDITDPRQTVVQDAFGFEGTVFDWFGSHPEKMAHFHEHMAARGQDRDVHQTWLSVYPVEAEARDWDPELPIFVDVGGGLGQQSARFRAKYPQIPGQVIHQDRPDVVAHALRTEGVTRMAHDFFQTQPIKGIANLRISA